MSVGKERNSSLEMLRMLAVSGIVFMHVLLHLDKDSLVGMNQIIYVFTLTLFNAGVSIFILLSGWFAIKFSFGRLSGLWCAAFFYSVLSYGIDTVISGDFSMYGLFRACTPVMSKQNWFVTTYILLFVFSGVLNRFCEHIEREYLLKMILVSIFIFYFLSTFLHVTLFGDNGKGIVHMSIVYLCDRYLKIYHGKQIERLKKKKQFWVWSAVIIFGVEFLINMLVTAVVKRNVYPMSYDSSIFTLLLAICLLIIFLQKKYYNEKFNKFTSHVLAICLFNRPIISLLNLGIDISEYAGSTYLFCIVLFMTFITIICCVITDVIRKIIFNKFEDCISVKLEWICLKAWGKIKKILLK